MLIIWLRFRELKVQQKQARHSGSVWGSKLYVQKARRCAKKLFNCYGLQVKDDPRNRSSYLFTSFVLTLPLFVNFFLCRYTNAFPHLSHPEVESSHQREVERTTRHISYAAVLLWLNNIYEWKSLIEICQWNVHLKWHTVICFFLVQDPISHAVFQYLQFFHLVLLSFFSVFQVL